MPLTDANRRVFQRSLRHWFSRHQRDLPWRRNRNLYRIWISEMMLQQTQVKTVVPYYRRWLKEFPTIQSLARAPLDRVLKAWEGLGYYRRAAYIHSAAKIIVKNHGGTFPRRLKDVLALPGVGRYTAGAICSIGYDMRVPVLDGNVARVLCRFFGVRANPKSPQGQQILWQLAENLLPDQRVGQFNESLMEVGATVCLPQTPKCEMCPLKKNCYAYRTESCHRFPDRGARQRPIKIFRAAAFVQTDDRKMGLLLCREQNGTRLHRLWRLPAVDLDDSASNRTDIESLFKKERNLRLRLLSPVTTIEHPFTRYRICVTAWRTKLTRKHILKEPSDGNVKWRWFSEAQIRQIPTDAPTRRLLKTFLANRDKCREGQPPINGQRCKE